MKLFQRDDNDDLEINNNEQDIDAAEAESSDSSDSSDDDQDLWDIRIFCLLVNRFYIC